MSGRKNRFKKVQPWHWHTTANRRTRAYLPWLIEWHLLHSLFACQNTPTKCSAKQEIQIASYLVDSPFITRPPPMSGERKGETKRLAKGDFHVQLVCLALNHSLSCAIYFVYQAACMDLALVHYERERSE